MSDWLDLDSHFRARQDGDIHRLRFDTPGSWVDDDRGALEVSSLQRARRQVIRTAIECRWPQESKTT